MGKLNELETEKRQNSAVYHGTLQEKLSDRCELVDKKRNVRDELEGLYCGLITYLAPNNFILN